MIDVGSFRMIEGRARMGEVVLGLLVPTCCRVDLGGTMLLQSALASCEIHNNRRSFGGGGADDLRVF